MNTPENITRLEPNEIIVVGTNMLGSHGGGLARYAKEHFGLQDGKWLGLSGQCYCIPTLTAEFQKVPLQNLKLDLKSLARFAKLNPDKTIYMTKIGLGIAGFTLKEIKSCLPKFPNNVILPIEFEKNTHAVNLGSLGGKITKSKYSRDQRVQWGKKGGRPKKI